MNTPITRVPRQELRPPVASGAGLTHRGRVRDRNEDSILTDPGGTLWAVADGMGGYGHGDVASDLVIDTLTEIAEHDEAADALHAKLTRANTIVFERSCAPGQGRMGATVVAALIVRGTAYIAWVGDSRAYLYRSGNMRLLTHDHTVVQELVDRGELSPDAAEGHPESHVITRAVGAAAEIEIDQIRVPLAVGDRLLLCSDGLPRCVYEPTIASLLGRAASAEEACTLLIQEALDRDAPDNVSVIVVEIAEG